MLLCQSASQCPHILPVFEVSNVVPDEQSKSSNQQMTIGDFHLGFCWWCRVVVQNVKHLNSRVTWLLLENYGALNLDVVWLENWIWLYRDWNFVGVSPKSAGVVDCRGAKLLCVFE